MSGYVFMYGGGAISWSSQKQKSVSVSTSEAEYIALGEAVREALYLQNLFKQIGLDFTPTKVYEDNQAAMAIVKNPVFHNRQKHIDIQLHFVCDIVEKKKLIQVEYCPMNYMVADIFTKPLPQPVFEQHRKNLGINWTHNFC